MGLNAIQTRLKFRGKPIVKQEYLDKTHDFFEKYGTKTIIMARFVPIVRTFTPFVAGVGKMEYRKKFLPFDVVGGILWISSMSLAGYFLGSNPWVKAHFEAVVVGNGTRYKNNFPEPAEKSPEVAALYSRTTGSSCVDTI